MSNIIQQYKELGERWARGEVDFDEKLTIGDKEWTLTPTQLKFLNARERYVLASGGIASGKTSAFLIKLILLSVCFPGNRLLLGRKTRTNVESSLLPDFFDICPPSWVEYKVGPGIIKFFNGSEILIKGLDMLQSGTESDLKKAVAEVRGLNLGGVFIDQLEEIEQKVVEVVGDRMRRNLGFQQFNATTNPANYWGSDYFIANPRPNTKSIVFNPMENKVNLPEAFIQDRLQMGETYVRKMIYGEWTPELMASGGAVFPGNLIGEQRQFWQKEPVRELDGIKIFEETGIYTYQIGVDPSEGIS